MFGLIAFADESTITLDAGEDSMVIMRPGSKYVTKRYWKLSSQEVYQYIQLQELLSQTTFLIDLTDVRCRYGVSLEAIDVSFLNPGYKVYSHQNNIYHDIPFVSGDTLDSLDTHVDCQDMFGFLYYVEQQISLFLSRALGVLPHRPGLPHTFYITRTNIKIISIEKGVLRLIVTDIGASIEGLLNENRLSIESIIDANFQ